MIKSKMDGKEVEVGKFASSLRKRLWMEFLTNVDITFQNLKLNKINSKIENGKIVDTLDENFAGNFFLNNLEKIDLKKIRNKKRNLFQNLSNLKNQNNDEIFNPSSIEDPISGYYFFLNLFFLN
jgi:hypothetical protein